MLNSDKPKIAFVLGIRPDLVRAAPLFQEIATNGEFQLTFIWSGQHYSPNLKDSFISELRIPTPNIELNVDVESDLSIVSSGIDKLGKFLIENHHEAVMFLGDTNTVLLSIAPSILNVPVIHIEGCMRSFDLNMPEERNRRIIDKISCKIYAYLDRYKEIGIQEGLIADSIVVTGNLAVDAVQYFRNLGTWEKFIVDYKEVKDKLVMNQDYTKNE